MYATGLSGFRPKTYDGLSMCNRRVKVKDAKQFVGNGGSYLAATDGGYIVPFDANDSIFGNIPQPTSHPLSLDTGRKASQDSQPASQEKLETFAGTDTDVKSDRAQKTNHLFNKIS